ncbi:hypothetical protein BAE44_0025646, partial [Dichanthelium oligosanthes]
MCAVAPAARPLGAGVARRAAPVRSRAAASARAFGSKKPVNPALDLLHKRMATELEALRELVKKAELVSRGSACKSGAAPTGKSKRLVAAEPRPEPRVEAGGKTPAVKRRKVSPLLVQNQKQIKVLRMLPDEREKLAGRLTSLAELPGHIVGFLQQQFGNDADPNGEIEIDIQKVEDSVLLDLKRRLDKFAEERLSADVLPKEQDDSVMMELDSKMQMGNTLAQEIKGDVVPEQEEEDVDICGGDAVPEQEEYVDICGLSDSESDSCSSSDSDGSSSSSDSDGRSSDSDSDSESNSDEEVDSPAPPAVLQEENVTSSQPPPDPVLETVQSTEPGSVSDDGVDSPAPPALLPVSNVVNPARPPSHRASEVAQSAEPKKVEAVKRAAPKAVCIPGLIFRAK